MIDIKRNNTTILSVQLPDKATHRKELMTSNVISLDFALSDYIDLKKGDYIVYENSTYKLTADYFAETDDKTGGYLYNLEFHGIEKYMEDFLLMYVNQGLSEVEFNLTAKLSVHVDVVISSLLRAYGVVFTYPQSVTDNTVVKYIEYSNLSILDGIQLIADTYELEWWFDGTVFNVGSCELGTEVELIKGRELNSVDYNQSSEKMITRLPVVS